MNYTKDRKPYWWKEFYWGFISGINT